MTLLELLPTRGTHVHLRRWERRDAEPLRHWSKPGHAWQRTDGPYFAPPPPDVGERRASRLLAQLDAGDPTLGGKRLPIVEADGPAIGMVSRYPIDETGWTAIGLVIWDPAHWNRGYGRDAVRLWVDLLFRTEPELHRLDLRTWSGNLGMMRVAEHLGFTLEARFREARELDGQRYDGLGYGLLRREWAGATSAFPQ